MSRYAFLKNGSTLSFIDHSFKRKLKAQGIHITLDIAGIHETEDLENEKIALTIRRMKSKVHLLEVFVHPSPSLGVETIKTKTEAKIQTLEYCLVQLHEFDGSWHHFGSGCL